jgi:WD40 repeat protein
MNPKSSRFLGLVISTLFFAKLCSGVCPGSLHQTTLSGYALSPDAKRIAALADDGSLFWWDVASGKRTQLLDCVKPGIFDTPILFTPDSTRVVVVDDNKIHFLEVSSGRLITELKVTNGTNLRNVVFSGDGKRLAANHDKGVTVWNVESGAEIMSCDGRIDRKALALSGNGNLLAVGHDGIELWDLQKNAIVRKIQLGEREHAESVIFADNDHKIVADIATALPAEQAKHGLLQFKYHFVVWSVASGEKRKSFARPSKELRFPLTFVAPRMLITVDYGDYLRLWDLDSGELTETWETPSGHPSADGKLFLREGGAPGRLELLEIGGPDESARAFEYRSPLCTERISDEAGSKKVNFQDFGLIIDGWNDEREHTGWSSSVAPDCTPVGFSHTDFKTAQRARNDLNRQTSLATEVLEKGPPKDFWQQAILGDRVVARFANKHSQSDTMAVMWVEDNVFYRISSSSLMLALAMERQRLQEILKK